MMKTIINIQKYKMSTLWKTMLLLCLSLSFCSCAKDTLQENLPEPEPGVPVQVELNFRVPQFDNPQEPKSRTATERPSGNTFHVALIADSLHSEPGEAQSKSENVQPTTRATDAPLYNLWVFQFSANGNVRKAIRVSTDEKPIYENQTIEVELMTGSDQTIYLLSLGRRYGHVDLSGMKSLDELEATSFEFIRYENGLPTPVITRSEDVPYRGSCYKLSIIQLEENGKGYVDYNNSDGFGGAINMKALVSLITIDFTYQVEKMTPFSISLNNVPTTFAVNNAIHKPSQFVTLPTTLLDPRDFENGKRVTMSWYMAPNPQGTVPTITSETDRYFYYTGVGTNSRGKAPRDGTYIHIWASEDATPNRYALYYLFLGSNTTNDFNIHPHSHYRYRTDINTAEDLNDKRIVYKTLKQTVDFSVSESSTYTPSSFLLRKGSRYDLDAHPDMRPIEITALRGTVSVEILPGSDNGVATTWPSTGVAPINPSSSWLKLSVYPNYTEALSAFQKGDPNGLATSINLNATIPGLFKLYLYSDEYEKYVHDNTNNDIHKRSLFVRFTFRTSTDNTEVYDTRMDQLPAFYLGEFGGEPAMNNGEFRYPKGLVVEARSEYKSSQYLSYMPSNFDLYSAYGVYGSSNTTPSDAQIRNYGAYDTYNGRSATIKMAENKLKVSPIAIGNTYLNQIQEPRYVNGYVDLYQYKYYTGDGFAQRWCYDKNRDKDGNGYLDDSEIVWYMPSVWQVFPIALNLFTTTTDFLKDKSVNGFFMYGLHSTTMPDRTHRLGFNFYTLTHYNNLAHNKPDIRCVRDVEQPIAASHTGVKYYAEEGYPVIDAMGLMAGVTEDRVYNSNVVIMPGPGDDPSYRGRVIRHYGHEGSTNENDVHPILRKVSRRFRVAPHDVDKNGNAITAPVQGGNVMTWAEASGYATEANTLAITVNKTGIATTGCAAYKGKDGTDEEGRWRLPTHKEAFLIAMMDQAMEADQQQTNYIPLFNIDGSGIRYWTATEVPDKPESGNYAINRAFCITASGKVKAIGGEGNPYAWETSNQQKSNLYKIYTRCIYDLH